MQQENQQRHQAKERQKRRNARGRSAGARRTRISKKSALYRINAFFFGRE